MSSTSDQIGDIVDQAAYNDEQQDTQSYDNDVNNAAGSVDRFTNDAAQTAEHPFQAAENAYDDVKDEAEKPFEAVGRGYDDAKGYMQGGYDDAKGDVERPFDDAGRDVDRYEQDGTNDKDQYERQFANDLDQDAQN